MEKEVVEGGKKKPLCDRCIFVGRQKFMLGKVEAEHYYAEWSTTPFFASPFPPSPRHRPTTLIPPTRCSSFQLFQSPARLLGPPARRNAASPLIKSSLSVTALAHSLAPSKAGLPVVVVVGGGKRMKRPLKSRPASHLPLMRSIQPI